MITLATAGEELDDVDHRVSDLSVRGVDRLDHALAEISQ